MTFFKFADIFMQKDLEVKVPCGSAASLKLPQCSRGGVNIVDCIKNVKSPGTSVAPENFEVAPIESPFYTIL